MNKRKTDLHEMVSGKNKKKAYPQKEGRHEGRKEDWNEGRKDDWQAKRKETW